MGLKNSAYIFLFGLLLFFPHKSLGEDHWQKYFSKKLELFEKEGQKKENLETLFLKSQILISDMYLYFLTQNQNTEEVENIFYRLKNLSINLENKLSDHKKNTTSQSFIENCAILQNLKTKILPKNFRNIDDIKLSLSSYLYYDLETIQHKLLVFFLPYSSQEQTIKTYINNFLTKTKQAWEENLSLKQEKNLPLLLENLSQLQKVFKSSKGKLSEYTNRIGEFLNLYDEIMNLSEDLTSFNILYQNKKSLLFLFQSLKAGLYLLLTSEHLTGNIYPFIYKDKEIKTTYFGLMNLQERLEQIVSETTLLYKNNEDALETLIEEKELRNIAFLITQLKIIPHIYWPGMFSSIIRKLLFQEPFFRFHRIDPSLER
ncbi:MAG: hypothetical protein HYW47_06320 [Deltaproteobacteria bacterium]|nr:hypothetical protein [Deltaproteobacteria bacterium]